MRQQHWFRFNWDDGTNDEVLGVDRDNARSRAGRPDADFWKGLNSYETIPGSAPESNPITVTPPRETT